MKSDGPREKAAFEAFHLASAAGKTWRGSVRAAVRAAMAANPGDVSVATSWRFPLHVQEEPGPYILDANNDYALMIIHPGNAGPSGSLAYQQMRTLMQTFVDLANERLGTPESRGPDRGVGGIGEWPESREAAHHG